MRRQAIAVITATLLVVAQAAPLLAWGRRGGGGGRGRGGGGWNRGSVSAASRGSFSHSGGSASWQSQSGRASASKSVNRTDSGATVNKNVETQSGASKSVSRDIDTEDRSVDRSSTTTNAWGQSASRDRTVQNEGGYASVEGSARTSTGREASGEGVAGRNVYGQPSYAGTVNTKYGGNYNVAGARNPYGGWTRATAGPYGGKVTTTLPAGYRTTTYHGRSYYSYGGAYYRPYTYGGAHYYYPVPPPYYSYYESPPVGAMVLMVAGVSYMMSKDGSYSKKTTNSQGQEVYQAVPAPQGAKVQTLPATRVLVTVSGTTYYLCSNAFYRRVMEGQQEHFVVVTAPAGVVFVQALPADFEVVNLNTMYFKAEGKYYLPYLSADGSEMYVMVDPPPTPSGQPTAADAAAAPAAAAPPVRTVSETLQVPAGTLLLVRLASDVSSSTAHAGDRFQGFLDVDLAAEGKLVAPKGSRVYGVVVSAEHGDNMRTDPSLSVTLTDLQVGSTTVPVKTSAVSAKGEAGHGGKKIIKGAHLGKKIGESADPYDIYGEQEQGRAAGAMIGMAAASKSTPDAAVLPAQSMQSFTVSVPLEVQVVTNVAVR
jgi:hypothetical protein